MQVFKVNFSLPDILILMKHVSWQNCLLTCLHVVAMRHAVKMRTDYRR